MSRALSNTEPFGAVVFLSSLLTLGLLPGAFATTVCDTDPGAVDYTPTVDPTLLNALVDTLGVIDVNTTAGQGVRLLYNHTLNVTLDSFIDLAGADFIVTPGFGNLEVDLMIPGWSANLSTSMSHASCRNCSSEYNSCTNGCDDDYDDCFGDCKPDCVSDCEDLFLAPPCFGNTACCGLACDGTCGTFCGTALGVCEAGCLTARGVCETDALACAAEREAINLLLSGYSFGMSFSSATLTQTADICVSGECSPTFPVESTDAQLDGFTLNLFPTGDPLGVGSWLNGIISGIVNWALDIENTIAGFFETPEGGGVLILPFAVDIATDGCLPAQPVLDCVAGGCSTLERPKGRIDRSANMLFYALPALFVLGLVFWRRKR
jgi:hypothetical protein